MQNAQHPVLDSERRRYRIHTLVQQLPAFRDTVFMEEGTKTKKTIFVGGIGDDVDENALIETFSTFGAFAFFYFLHYLMRVFS